MSVALYRKYRSKTLDEVIGQEHVTNVLSRAIDAGKVAHAYLLTGPRGVGKTSIARILAHQINSLEYTGDGEHLDIIEIDAASNNGVEDVRDLREKVRLAPVAAPKKVYIIDEVHMLSKPAFNALLKTLEEPPEHAVFILATTDVDKIPATIISRTQRFGFKPIAINDAVDHLARIAKSEDIKISTGALAMIAERGDGSFRDSISLLDQLSAIAGGETEIDERLVEATLGLAENSAVNSLLMAVKAHDQQTVIEILNKFSESGIQPTVLVSQMIKAVRNDIVHDTSLLPLLEQLLEVGKSTRPDIRLFTILVSATSEVLSVVPTPSSATPVSQKIINEAPKKEVAPIKTTPKQPVTAKKEPAEKKKEVAKKVVKKDDSGKTINLDWPKFVAEVKKHHVGLSGILKTSGQAFDGNTLTIYAGNKLYKSKLDEERFRRVINDSLTTLGISNLQVETLAEKAPLQNSQAASVADIMGGGEEVNFNGEI